MASIFKECLILMTIYLWQVCNFASTGQGIYYCRLSTNLTSCRTCSYYVSMNDNGNISQSYACCDADENLASFPENYLNKTFTEVSMSFGAQCHTNNYIIDVTFVDAVSLSLRNNNISDFRLIARPLHLREIDLSNNKVEYIKNGVFNNYTYLRKLILSKNNIRIVFDDSFVGLSKLETLDLSENKLVVLTNVFTPLKSLQHLNLSRNNIEFIHENYFNNWLLQHLDVSHNNLRKLAPGALQLLPNLARLLLTDNPHLGITQLDTQLLVGTGRRLQQIDASRTGLYQVPEAFTHSVRFLSLVGNKISSIRCGDLDSYPLLQSLDFSDNKIIAVEDDSLGRLEMLLFLNINKNLLNTVPRSLPDELKYLSINDNLVKNLTIPDFKNLPNLQILQLKNNQIRYIQDHVFDDLLSLEMLDLSNNPIQKLYPSTFDGPLSLRDLRLCFLNISVPEQDSFFPMSSPESVQMLHLQSSPGLARQLLADSAALAAFSHLQYLDLRMNNLTGLRNDLLFYLVQLKTLRLHGNNLNCRNELWLTDWMNWNKSLSTNETCYYSTSDAKSEIIKYNCTFPETFTISDSLPPVNLYSTEMINKLLRYYGYLNNKSNKNSTKRNNKHNSSLKSNVTFDENTPYNIIKNKQTLSSSQSNTPTNSEDFIENKISQHYINETSAVKAKESAKILDQNKVQNDQLNVDHRFLDIDHYFAHHTSKKEENIDVVAIKNKISSGKRLNTPILTAEIESNVLVTVTETAQKMFSTNEDNTINPNGKLEYSPYKFNHTNYAQYIGMVAVTSLIVMALILWASFRLRYRKRQTVAIEAEVEDQIEVSNISGRVLW